MKSRLSFWLKGGVLSAVAAVGLSACSDDHFDISSSTATTTLWENITSNAQLDSFKMILQGTPVTKDEFDTKSTITYADLLASPQTFTVWAPENGTYNAAYWLNLLSEGSSRVVETQFVRNHVSRYNFSGSNADSVRVTMLNSKVNVYSPLDQTFRGVSVVGNAVPASNGTLHLIDGAARYVSNLYESIEFTQNLDSLYNFLHENDTLMFNAAASTPGATVDGEVQYVDSVFYRSNSVVGSLILWQNEDSLLLGIVPTNDAWDAAKAIVSKYYNYKSSYPYRNNFSTTILFNRLNADSMQDARVKNVILNNIVYSLAKQPGYEVNRTSLEYCKNFLAQADSIVRDGATSLTNPNVHNPYFNNVIEGVEPYEVSNGYVYAINDYKFAPSKFWHNTIRVEAENNYYQNVNGFSSAQRNGNYFGTNTYLTALNRNDSIKGTVSGDAYCVFNGLNSASQPTVSFKLPNVKSGTYDIYAVMVPLNMDRADVDNADAKRNRFTATLTYDYRDNGRDITVNAVNEADGTAYFETRAGVVDSVLLFRDYKFQYAYDNVTNCYPMLSLRTVIRNAAQRAAFDPALYIDCILLVAKDDE